MNKQLEDQAAEGWELEDAFAAAGDVVLLFGRASKPAEKPANETS